MVAFDWSNIEAINYTFRVESTSKYARLQQHFKEHHSDELSDFELTDMFIIEDGVKVLVPDAITSLRMKIAEIYLDELNIGNDKQRNQMKDHIAVLLAETTFKGNLYGRPASIRDNSRLDDMAEEAYSRGDTTLHLELSMNKWIFSRNWQPGKFLSICIEDHSNKFHKNKDDAEPSPELLKPKLIKPSAVKPVNVLHLEPIAHSDDDLKLVVTTPAIVTPKEIISIRKPKIFPSSDLNPPCELKPAIARPSKTLVNHHEDRNRPTQANAGNPEASSDNKDATVAPTKITKINNARLSGLVLGNLSTATSSSTDDATDTFVPYDSLPILPPSQPPPFYSSHNKHEFVPSGFKNSLPLLLSPDSGSGGVVIVAPNGTDNPKQEERKERKPEAEKETEKQEQERKKERKPEAEKETEKQEQERNVVPHLYFAIPFVPYVPKLRKDIADKNLCKSVVNCADIRTSDANNLFQGQDISNLVSIQSFPHGNAVKPSIPYTAVPLLPPSEPPPMLLSNSPVHSSPTDHEFVPSTFDKSLSLLLSPDSGSGGVVVPNGILNGTYNPKQEERKKAKHKAKQDKRNERKDEEREVTANDCTVRKDIVDNNADNIPNPRTSIAKLPNLRTFIAGNNAVHNPDLFGSIVNAIDIRTSVSGSTPNPGVYKSLHTVPIVTKDINLCTAIVNKSNFRTFALMDCDLRSSVANDTDIRKHIAGDNAECNLNPFSSVANDTDIRKDMAGDNAEHSLDLFSSIATDTNIRTSDAPDRNICTSVAKFRDLRTSIAGNDTDPGVYEFVPSGFNNLLSFLLSPDSGSGGEVVPNDTDNPKQEERKERNKAHEECLVNVTSSSHGDAIKPSIPHILVPALPPSEPPPIFLYYSSLHFSQQDHVFVPPGFDNSMSLLLSSDSGSGGVTIPNGTINPKQEERTERKHEQEEERLISLYTAKDTDTLKDMASDNSNLRTSISSHGRNTRTSIAGDHADHYPDLCTSIANDTDIRTSVTNNTRTSAAIISLERQVNPIMIAFARNPDLSPVTLNTDLRTYTGSDTNTDFLRTSIPRDTDFPRISTPSNTDIPTSIVNEANLCASVSTERNLRTSIANEHPDICASIANNGALLTSVVSDDANPGLYETLLPNNTDIHKDKASDNSNLCTSIANDTDLHTSVAEFPELFTFILNADLRSYRVPDQNTCTSVAADRELHISVVNLVDRFNTDPGVHLTLPLPHSSRCESGGVVQNCIYNPQQQERKERKQEQQQDKRRQKEQRNTTAGKQTSRMNFELLYIQPFILYSFKSQHKSSLIQPALQSISVPQVYKNYPLSPTISRVLRKFTEILIAIWNLIAFEIDFISLSISIASISIMLSILQSFYCPLLGRNPLQQLSSPRQSFIPKGMSVWDTIEAKLQSIIDMIPYLVTSRSTRYFSSYNSSPRIMENPISGTATDHYSHQAKARKPTVIQYYEYPI